MQRINSPDGQYHNDDPLHGTAGTIVTAEALNALQEEICTVIAAAGITLNGAAVNQLYQAILALTYVDDATTESKGVAKLADTAETIAGVNATDAVTPAGLKAALISALLASARWVELPDATVLSAGVRLIPANTAGAVNYTLPAEPVDGDTVAWRQGSVGFGTHEVIFVRNGNTIMALDEDMSVATDTACGALVWREDLGTWWVYATGLSGTETGA